MRRGPRRSGARDYLELAIKAFVAVFILAFVAFSVSALLVQREHVAFERANRKCEAGAPSGVTGWKLDWNPDTETFTCIFGGDGRPTGQMLRFRRSDL